MSLSERPSSRSSEFEFESSKREHVNGHGKDDTIPLDQDPTAVVFKAPSQKEHSSKSHSKGASMDSSSHPTPLNARKNLERQAKEQKFFSTVLNSAATFMLIAIISIGALAGIGGYILWKQIQQQSVTVSMMDANLRKEIAKLRDEEQKAEAKLSRQQEITMVQTTALRTQVDAQNVAIKELNSQIEVERNRGRQFDARMTQVSRLVQRMNEQDRLNSRKQ
jgi:hypothetical protein